MGPDFVINNLYLFAKLYNIAFLRQDGKPILWRVHLEGGANWRCLERPKGATCVGGRATVLRPDRWWSSNTREPYDWNCWLKPLSQSGGWKFGQQKIIEIFILDKNDFGNLLYSTPNRYKKSERLTSDLVFLILTLKNGYRIVMLRVYRGI